MKIKEKNTGGGQVFLKTVTINSNNTNNQYSLLTQTKRFIQAKKGHSDRFYKTSK